MVDVLLIVGICISAFYTVLPHSVHMRLSPDYWLLHWDLPHPYHLLLGVLVGLSTLYYAQEKYNIFNR